MKMIRSISTLLVAFVLILSLASCSNNDPTPTPLNAVIFKNLNADYAPIVINSSGPPTRPAETKKFTFFSFTTGAVVANADSATAKWDVGFRGTTIICNSGSSGKGSTKVQLIKGIFEDITKAPDSGYLSDNQADNKKPVKTSYAIQEVSGKGWYNYDGVTNIISPIAGTVLLFQTADGKYAKMEIQNYYQDSPNPPAANSKDRYYTFRYIYQPNGTTNF
jgi:hypothetical protein